MSNTIEKKYFLIVEGKDEVSFFDNLLKYLLVPKSQIQIEDFKGKDNFPPKIKVFPKRPNFNLIEKIIFVRDADENYSTAFQSIQDALKRNNLPFPEEVNIFSSPDKKPQTAIYIMPRKGVNGMLEDLCLESIHEEEVKCIENYLNSIPQKPKELSKSKVLIFLASREVPINSLGLGAAKKYWDFDHPCFAEIKELLLQLKEEN